jgi:chromosome segregation ATPase
MLRLLNLAKHSAFVLTGVTIGAALWKSRSSADTSSADAGPLKQSVADLEARLATLENGSGQHSAETDATHNQSAETLRAVASLDARLGSLASRYDGRLAAIENHVASHDAKLAGHDAKLKELPTLAQVVSTMEEMLSSTMSGLDQKLSDQVKSIEVLKTTVAQSDELMERVLDSIYSLQSHVAESDKSEVPVSV